MSVVVVAKEVQKKFNIKTDIEWDDFESRAQAQFDDPQARLAYKLSNDPVRPPPFQLDNADDFREAIDRAIELCTRARSKKVEMTLYNKVRAVIFEFTLVLMIDNRTPLQL